MFDKLDENFNGVDDEAIGATSVLGPDVVDDVPWEGVRCKRTQCGGESRRLC